MALFKRVVLRVAYNVMIDPGHGGYDPGAVGNGLTEKDITLAIAKALVPLLVNNGIAVGMTRTEDKAPGGLENRLNDELNYRVKLSNDYNADLFVSIHINSDGGTGEEVLISGFGGNAERAAKCLLPYLCAVGGWPNRGIKTQNVLVLEKTNAPAILTESGFIDSVSDSNRMKQSDFIQAIATAHAKGICDYFGLVYRDKTVQLVPDLKPVISKNDQVSNLLTQALNLLKG